MAKDTQRGYKPKGTTIKECDCEHTYQDKTYGKRNRVMNNCKDKTQKCTVCNKVHH